MIVLFGRPTSTGVQSEGRQVSLYSLQLHVKQLKWNQRKAREGEETLSEREASKQRWEKQNTKKSYWRGGEDEIPN